jgi:protein phosphatase 1 regulatory subunit 11
MADHRVSGSSIRGREVGGVNSSPAPSVGTRGGAARVSAATLTLTETSSVPATSEVLRLSLVARPTVRWDENVQDNEGLGRRSSKRCCIFHKQRDFGESSTDSSDDENDDSFSDSGDDDDKKPKATKRKITKPKAKRTPVPDHQRFHA